MWLSLCCALELCGLLQIPITWWGLTCVKIDPSYKRNICILQNRHLLGINAHRNTKQGNLIEVTSCSFYTMTFACVYHDCPNYLYTYIPRSRQKKPQTYDQFLLFIIVNHFQMVQLVCSSVRISASNELYKMHPFQPPKIIYPQISH